MSLTQATATRRVLFEEISADIERLTKRLQAAETSLRNAQTEMERLRFKQETLREELMAGVNS